MLAATAWTVDIALAISNGAAGPALLVKAVLIVCFAYYAYRVFFRKHNDKAQ